MRLLGRGLILVFGLVMVFGTTASAQVATNSNNVRVQARVLPKTSIIVDDFGNIRKILSNTDQDVLPVVYKNQITTANQIELSDQVFKLFKTYVPNGRNKLGVITVITPVFMQNSPATRPVPSLNELLVAIGQ